MRTYDAHDRGVPATGFAHTVVICSTDGTPLDRPAVRAGVATLVGGAERTGRFADLSGARADFAPDGRTAQVDLADDR